MTQQTTKVKSPTRLSQSDFGKRLWLLASGANWFGRVHMTELDQAQLYAEICDSLSCLAKAIIAKDTDSDELLGLIADEMAEYARQQQCRLDRLEQEQDWFVDQGEANTEQKPKL